MRIVDFASKNILTRHSLIRLREDGTFDNIDVNRVERYLKGVTQEPLKISKEIIRADRCIKFIEGIKFHKIEIDTEDIIITLLTLYPHDMVAESILRVGFRREISDISKILSDNVLNNINPFVAAIRVLDKIVYCRLVKTNVLAAMYLVVNLMLVKSGKMIILEDTDEVSSALTLDMQMEVEKNVPHHR